MLKRLRPLLFAVSSLFAAGCNDLPKEEYIEYPRLLGIRAKVVSSPHRDINSSDTRPYAEALPFEEVELDALIATPRGAMNSMELRGRWLACELLPQTGPGDCLRGYIRDKDPAIQKINPCPDAEALLPPSYQDAGSVPTRTPPCFLRPSSGPLRYSVPASLNMLLGASMEFWYIASLRDGPGTGKCIGSLLAGEYELDDGCLYGVTRLDIGPLAILLESLAKLGINPALPQGPSPSENPANPPLPPEALANRHPRIAMVSYTIEKDEVAVSPTRVLGPGDLIEAPLDSTVRLEISLPTSELQAYPVPVNDGEAIVLRTEEYISQWFYSWGQFESASDRKEIAVERWQLSPDSEQEQEEKRPGEGVFAYFVVRDDRGGIDWRSIDLRLLPEGSQSSVTPATALPF